MGLTAQNAKEKEVAQAQMCVRERQDQGKGTCMAACAHTPLRAHEFSGMLVAQQIHVLLFENFQNYFQICSVCGWLNLQKLHL
jgi:hypothetical protein